MAKPPNTGPSTRPRRRSGAESKESAPDRLTKHPAGAASKESAPDRSTKRPADAASKGSAPNRSTKRPADPAAACHLAPGEIDTLFQRLYQANPAPRSDLEYRDPFTLLIAVLLSAQATDAGVNKATQRLFAEADTPRGILDLGLDRVKEHIKTVGLFNTKTKNVIALCEILEADYAGQVPRDRAALEALPGVGRKTANVVLNVAFGEPTIAVDTHIFRVGNRTGLAPGKTPDAVEAVLVAVVPERWIQNAHHWLILHGRYVCKARKPVCSSCPISDICRFPDKLPAPDASPTA